MVKKTIYKTRCLSCEQIHGPDLIGYEHDSPVALKKLLDLHLRNNPTHVLESITVTRYKTK